MKIISPLELADIDLSHIPDRKRVHEIDGMRLLWADQETFGPYLRALRSAVNLSLRAVAEQMGISHTLLARLESGDRVGPPPLALLDDLAHTYRSDLRQMLHEAGYRLEVTKEPEITLEQKYEAYFKALVLDPRVRPPLIHDQELAFIPFIVKRYWVDHVQLLAKQDDPEALVDEILDRVDDRLEKTSRREGRRKKERGP